MYTEQDLDLAWLAGILEGEGSIRIGRKRYAPEKFTYFLEVSVTMTDKECIDLLQSISKVGSVANHHLATEKKKHSWIWAATSVKASGFLVEIEPFIKCKRVRDKLKLALEFQSQKKHGAARYIDGYSEIQEGYWQKMAELNIRGTNNRKESSI